jgi:DNA-binding MarR family transcriptional regulator
VRIGDPDPRRIHEIHFARLVSSSTYGRWGEALGLTKQGADALLKRLEGEGMVSIVRHESGEGIKASLTDLGLAVLRQIPEFDAEI